MSKVLKEPTLGQLMKHFGTVQISQRHFEALVGMAHRAGVAFGRENPKDTKTTRAKEVFKVQTLVDLFLNRPAASGKVQ